MIFLSGSALQSFQNRFSGKLDKLINRFYIISPDIYWFMYGHTGSSGKQIHVFLGSAGQVVEDIILEAKAVVQSLHRIV